MSYEWSDLEFGLAIALYRHGYTCKEIALVLPRRTQNGVNQAFKAARRQGWGIRRGRRSKRRLMPIRLFLARPVNFFE